MGETMTGVTGVISPGLTAIIGFVVIDFLNFGDAQDATQKNNGPRQFSFNRPPAFLHPCMVDAVPVVEGYPEPLFQVWSLK
jgi:hypothetical protein